MEAENEVDWPRVESLIRSCCQSLLSLDNLERTLTNLRLMFSIYSHINRRNRFNFSQKVKNHNFLISAKNFLIKCGYQNKFDGTLFAISERIIGLLWNMCDVSGEICQQVLAANFHEMFIKDMKENEMLTLEILSNSEAEVPNSDAAQQRMHSYMGVLLNILKLYPESREELQKFGIVEMLINLLFVEDELLKSTVVFALAFSVDVHKEDEQSLNNVRRPTISFLVQHLLITAMENENITAWSKKKGFESNAEGRTVKFSASEVFECLNRLAFDGNNATEMIKHGIFAICESFLEATCDNESAMTMRDTSKHPAIQWALRLLWRISIIRETQFMFTFKDLITCFKDHPSSEVVENATGLLFSLEKLSASNKITAVQSPINEPDSSIEKQPVSLLSASAQKSIQKDGCEIPVMISYSWKQKETVLRLRNELEKIGKFKIWIDDDHMHKSRNIREEMANAVDNADLVICCYSKAYAESENCMTEFNYSCDFKKTIVFVRVEASEPDYRPRGSLGAVVAGKFYFDIATSDKFDQNFPKLVERLI